MSMLDSFFSKGTFKAAKCKTLLKLTIPRIKLLRNRREIQIKQMRRDIAKLLETGQEATARIRVEHILREEKMMAAQEIIELFSELIVVRLPIIEAQRECPLDLKEAISSVCFAAPRCADLPELLQVQMAFAGKYGKEFVAAATELMPECGVNRQLIELLSVHAPAPDVKLKLLKEIAEEHQLDWDPSASEVELLKPHEDLLNGPTQFASGSKLPIPKEKHDDESSLRSASGQAPQDEQSDSDSEFDLLDLPQVPNSVIMTGSVASALRPEMLPFPPSALSDLNQEPETDSDPKEALLEESVMTKEEPEELNTTTFGTNEEEKQFLPFISPPSSLPSKQINPVGELRNKNDVEVKVVDLQDVLAAAQAAAESAERAATAARSAATLAQVRISELVNKNNDHDSVIDKPSNPNGSGENPFSLDRQASSTHDHYHDDIIDSSSPQASHLPRRLPSLDDDPYFSYPNLFTSQQSNVSRTNSFADHSHSTTDGF